VPLPVGLEGVAAPFCILAPLPVVEPEGVPAFDTTNIVIECGPITMLTGSPFLSLALTMNEPGTILTSEKPCRCSFWLSSCGKFCAV
jgi:hypothetical protein